MTPTHLHLLITHLPIFGSILGLLVLVQGIWSKSNQTIIAAYTVFICSSVGAAIAYITGESAEETVEGLQGVAENMIEQHEDFAVFALSALIVLGVASLGGLFLTIKKSNWTKSTAMLISFIAIVSFVLVVRTGYLGGQIRHTEINNSPPTMQGHGSHSEDED